MLSGQGAAGAGITMGVMATLVHGIDLVEVERIATLEREHAERFVGRIYTQGELAYADARPKRRHEHLAGRFAIKEAVLKALGTGWSGGIRWTDVEVVSATTGRPTLTLRGEAERRARELGVRHWEISISHAAGLAIGSAVGLADAS